MAVAEIPSAAVEPGLERLAGTGDSDAQHALRLLTAWQIARRSGASRRTCEHLLAAYRRACDRAGLRTATEPPAAPARF